MKKFLSYLLSLTLLTTLAFLTSCGEDDEVDLDAPTIAISGADATKDVFTVGETVDLTFTFGTPAQLSSFNYQITVGTNTPQAKVFKAPADLGYTGEETTGSFDFSFPVPQDWAGQAVSIVFEIVDKENDVATTEFNFSVVATDVTEYSTKLLYAPDAAGNVKAFFSTNLGNTYSSNEVKNSSTLPNDIDFGYFYWGSNGATIASPANFPFEVGQSNWTNRNNTLIRKTNLTSSEYMEQGNSSVFIQNTFENATAGTNAEQARNLAKGSVVAFKTDADKAGGPKYGLILIDDIVDANNDGDFVDNGDYISISVKVGK